MVWRVLLTVAMAAGLASAQGSMGEGGMEGGSRGRGGSSGEGMAGGGMRMPRQSPFEQFAEKLKLSADEKTEARTILEDALKELAPVQQELQQTREHLAGTLINGQTGDPVDQLLKAYAPLAAKQAGIEARAFAKICKMLKSNQEKNAPQAFALLADMFDRPRSGGNRGDDRSNR